MKKFNLLVYKLTQQYMALFDVFLKEVPINKDAYLNELGITPSTYRRARNSEQKTGIIIVEKLSNKFGLKMAEKDFIDEMEQFFNKIYFNMYYKIYDTYDEDLIYIDKLIASNYNIFPLLKLMRLFLMINSQQNISTTLNDNLLMYEEVKKYEKFYTDEFLEILELLNLSFNNTFSDLVLSKKYSNPMANFILSSKCCLNKKYIESIHFANIAREMLLSENNYKRTIYLNLTTMNSLLSIQNYEDCYKLAYGQYYALQSIKDYDFEYRMTIKHLIVAAVGYKKYEFALELLNKKSEYSPTDVCCLLISKFELDENDYKKFYEEQIDLSIYREKDAIFIADLDEYLREREKEVLKRLEKQNIMISIYNILKWL